MKRIIDLSPYGHADSIFERKMVQVDDNKYALTGVSRIIGELENLRAVDFDGGPMLGRGTNIEDLIIKEFSFIGDRIYAYTDDVPR